jgi:predicted phage terminase large subunit-like protein
VVDRFAVAEYVRRNFTAFKRLMYQRYTHAPHLEELDQALMDVAHYVRTGNGGPSHLIVEMPPRHGKTLTISRFFPPWVFGGSPEKRVILASYGASLANKNSRFARNMVNAPRYRSTFPGVQLASDSKSADAWDIEGHEGGMDAVGVGGGVTGKGGHIIIVDDPVKSREEAESPVYRDKVYNWFNDDLYTRREPGAAVIVVMTRWHQDDLVGRLMRDDPDTWQVLSLPAISPDGGALWPGRYPLKELRAIETRLGPYSWSALYQQQPTPAEGGLFKREYFEPLMDVTMLPPMQHAVRYWDLAMSAKTSADYTVGVKIGQGGDGHYYVLDVVRRQLEWGDVVPFMAETMLADGQTVSQGIEEAGYMSRAVQDLNGDYRLHNHGIFGYRVDKDKVTRALPVAAKAASNTLHIVAAHWTGAFLDEVCSFPKAAHDDQVDALAGAWIMIGDEGWAYGEQTHAGNPRAVSASVY